MKTLQSVLLSLGSVPSTTRKPLGKIALVVSLAAGLLILFDIEPLFSSPTPTPNTILESNDLDARLGSSVSSAGDVNGDGYDDVIVGASEFNEIRLGKGAAYVYHGSPSGISTTPAAILKSNQTFAGFGSSVSGAGDVNGDGYADVIVGAQYYTNGQDTEGAAFVYHGSPSGISTTPAAMVESNQAFANFGFRVSGVGDVNGDGYDDVIVGAPGRYANIYHGGPTGISTAPAASVGFNLVSDVSGAGDVNGDGYADVVVGARYYTNGQATEGAAFVYHGSPSGISTVPAAMVESNQAGAQMGFSVSGAGDVNSDGYADVTVGALLYENGQENEGAAFIYHGGPSGIASAPAAIVESNQAGAWISTVSGAGDVNSDGYADVIVGAPHYANGEMLEGAAFVYLGGPSGISTTPRGPGGIQPGRLYCG